jgi:hypothetical protein
MAADRYVRRREWRDPDSNRGHHDFQSCSAAIQVRAICRENTIVRLGYACPDFTDFAVVSRALRPMTGLVGLFVTSPPRTRPARSRRGDQHPFRRRASRHLHIPNQRTLSLRHRQAVANVLSDMVPGVRPLGHVDCGGDRPPVRGPRHQRSQFPSPGHARARRRAGSQWICRSLSARRGFGPPRAHR